jgi:hypothetical protein
MASQDEPQLSFVVTKYWDRPAGDSGWTEMTCSQASFRRVLEWMLEELPEGSAEVRVRDGIYRVRIDMMRLPDSITIPSIMPRPVPRDENAAAVARVREYLALYAPRDISASDIEDLLDPQGTWTYSFATPDEAVTEVPEPGEPAS